MLLVKNGKTQLHIFRAEFKKAANAEQMWSFRQETSLETGECWNLEVNGKFANLFEWFCRRETQLWTCYSV
jgi:hypothetical protein